MRDQDELAKREKHVAREFSTVLSKHLLFLQCLRFKTLHGIFLTYKPQFYGCAVSRLPLAAAERAAEEQAAAEEAARREAAEEAARREAAEEAVRREEAAEAARVGRCGCDGGGYIPTII